MPAILRPDFMAHEKDVRAWHDTHYAHTTPETRRSAWRPIVNHQDPYNTDNFVSGWIQMIGGDEYGTLLIEEVNERPAPQRIMGTPKTAYPYHRDRSWLLHSAEWIRSAPKLDGTNICQYSYHDADGNRFTTFKLRTRPFVPANFRIMLDKTLRQYPGVARLQAEPGEAMIYELYGRQNPLLIIYPHDIDLIALCRRNPDSRDMEPADPENPAFTRLDCPLASSSGPSSWPSSWADIRSEYAARQSRYSQGLSKTEINGERAFYGQEGEMLYVRFPDGARSKQGAFTRLIKLKPPEIEEIHQALDHVPKEEAEATARNLWELTDDPQAEDLVTLLSEDWYPEQIKRSMPTIERVLEEAIERRHREQRILDIFHQSSNPREFREDPAVTMRKLQNKLPKSDMQKAFTILNHRLPLRENIP